jgi:hypothetical protein
MQLNQAIEQVDQKFVYQADPRSFFTDYWFVMQEHDGHLHGDCDDYSITVLWYMCNQNFWTFVWNVLILHRYRLHRVKTRTGEYHVVAQVGNTWFDNWTRRPCGRQELFDQTGHQYAMWYLSPIIAWFMLWGYLRYR